MSTRYVISAWVPSTHGGPYAGPDEPHWLALQEVYDEGRMRDCLDIWRKHYRRLKVVTFSTESMVEEYNV